MMEYGDEKVQRVLKDLHKYRLEWLWGRYIETQNWPSTWDRVTEEQIHTAQLWVERMVWNAQRFVEIRQALVLDAPEVSEEPPF